MNLDAIVGGVSGAVTYFALQLIAERAREQSWAWRLKKLMRRKEKPVQINWSVAPPSGCDPGNDPATGYGSILGRRQ